MKDDKPTSFDIAFRAGVSQSTVSRALRNSPLVNEETRLKVQQIARELNYKVDKNASSLRSQQTKTIALLLCEDHGTGNSLINPFFLSMLGSITRATASRGFDLLISFQQFSEDWHADYEDANRADGIIFLGYGDYETFVKKLTYLTEVGAHFITWGQCLKVSRAFPSAVITSIALTVLHNIYCRLGEKISHFLAMFPNTVPSFLIAIAAFAKRCKKPELK